MMTLDQITEIGINPALLLLPAAMDNAEARVMLLTIGLQESRFQHRRQMGNGPARGFWQFERGTQVSRGGVWGVYLHAASRELLQGLCAARDCRCEPLAIWTAIEHDDVLAAGVARLLLWTDARALPDVDDEVAAWALYMRTWRPGKPHPQTWAGYHRQARRNLGLP